MFKWFGGFEHAPYGDINLQSTHYITDLGSQALCDNKVTDGDGLESHRSAYSYIAMNITGVPVNIMMGICLPADCHESDFQAFTTKVTNSINSLLDDVD